MFFFLLVFIFKLLRVVVCPAATMIGKSVCVSSEATTPTGAGTGEIGVTDTAGGSGVTSAGSDGAATPATADADAAAPADVAAPADEAAPADAAPARA